MNPSLRLRLVLIILVPLLLIVIAVGSWAVHDAQQRAADRFDRSLLSAALAISRDVALSDGDALSPETDALLRDTSGGKVFYHVYAPDGVFVTGYATPPVPIPPPEAMATGQAYFDATYMDRDVRVLRFVDAMQFEGLSGLFTFTVWQDTELRDSIVRDLSWRTFRIIAPLVAAVALVVWFGVRLGLRPLNDLEDAISRRTSNELNPIVRSVPFETRGIVRTLNRLLGQVSTSMKEKDEFISNAAHQIRNPIAGIVAMSEAVVSARSVEDVKNRTGELQLASRRASDLVDKLLALERASGTPVQTKASSFDLSDLVRDLFEERQASLASQAERRIDLQLSLEQSPCEAFGDPTMIREAIANLIDNALVHGGHQLTRIGVLVRNGTQGAEVVVDDDGAGIAPEDLDTARARFGQVKPSSGSGLGLAIADAVASRHGGTLELTPLSPGLRVSIVLPSGNL